MRVLGFAVGAWVMLAAGRRWPRLFAFGAWLGHRTRPTRGGGGILWPVTDPVREESVRRPYPSAVVPRCPASTPSVGIPCALNRGHDTDAYFFGGGHVTGGGYVFYV